MRGTVHYLETEDSTWMLPLFEPLMAAGSRRRLEQLGLPAAQTDRAVAEIENALKPGEPLDRPALVERLRKRRVDVTADRWIHLVRLAVASNIACFGPTGRRGEPDLIAPAAWFPPRPRFDRDAALANLAQRYFRAFSPATEADFAKWAGLPLRDVRSGMSAIGEKLRRVEIGSEEGWAIGRARRPPASGFVRLLPGWDTYLMGYRDRSFLAPGDRWGKITPGGGMLLPCVLVDGIAVGVWRAKRAGERIDVTVEPFEHLDQATRKAIAAEVADLGRFEGLQAVLR